METRTCAECGAKFTLRRSDQKFCTGVCRRRAAGRRRYHRVKSGVGPDLTGYKCEVCGKTFTAVHNRQKRCSPECRRKAFNDYQREVARKRSLSCPPKPRECVVCGTKFAARSGTHVYCSDKCREAGKSKATSAGTIRECPWCGDKFVPQKPAQKFCCTEHRVLHTNRRIRLRNGSGVKSESSTRTCSVCGNEYYAPHCKSDMCRVCKEKAEKAAKPAGVCQMCGEPIPVNSTRRKYCSDKCAHKGMLASTRKYRSRRDKAVVELGLRQIAGLAVYSDEELLAELERRKNAKVKIA